MMSACQSPDFYWGLKVYTEVVLNFIGIRFEELFN